MKIHSAVILVLIFGLVAIGSIPSINTLAVQARPSSIFLNFHPQQVNAISNQIIETINLDTFATQPKPTVGTQILKEGMSYKLSVTGTFSIWWPDWWNSYCGKPEDKPLILSPNTNNGMVGFDAVYFFAAPARTTECNSSGSFPVRYNGFLASTDGGNSWFAPSSTGEYNKEHAYDFSISGKGKPVQFRIADYASNSDNYGVLKIVIQTDTSNTVFLPLVASSQSISIKAQIPVPFLTQIGSAGVPGKGSLNCGPASVAMVIQYFGDAITVNDAAIAIRGFNNSSNGVTDFKSKSTINLFSQHHLSSKSIYTFNDVQQELALGHPVIILVNNDAYRHNTPAPYVDDGAGWFTRDHIIVITGYDTNYVYVNDPLRYASVSLLDPANYTIPITTFKSATSTTDYSSTSSWYAISVFKQ